MPTKIIQIKGSNGSGKTTIVKQMLRLSRSAYHASYADGKVFATVMDELGYVAVGPYNHEAKMGGCDKLSRMEEIKQAILDIHDTWPHHWVVFEGMILSTIKTTMYDFLLDLEESSGIEPMFVILRASLDGCLRRIAGRGTMRDGLKPDNVGAKCEMVIRHAREYDPKYVRWMDVEATPIGNMLMKFLWKVQDNDLLDALNDYPVEIMTLDRSRSEIVISIDQA